MEKDVVELERGLDKKDPNLVESIADNIIYLNKSGHNWYLSIVSL